MDYCFDGMPHKRRGVIHHRVIQAAGKTFLQFFHFGTHIRRELERIRAGCLKDRQRHRGLIIQQGTQRITAGAEFDAGHVFEQRFFSVGTGLDNDLAKLVRGDQPALGIDLQFKINRRTHRLLANRSGRDLHILFANRIDNVARGQISCGHFVRVEPDPHGIIARAEDLHIAGAGNSGQHVFDLQRRIIADVNFVVAIVRRE